jgi:hypothetical protein
MVARRFLAFTRGELTAERHYLFDLQCVTHLLSGRGLSGLFGPTVQAGSAFIARNSNALPRVRLMGRPRYAAGEAEAIAAVGQLGPRIRDRLVVEDSDRPLPEDAESAGTAAITHEEPERVEVAIDARSAGYLVLADTYDPGWSATLDGRAAPVRPAWITFRAVHVPPGQHTLVFRYRPAGFGEGLAITLGAVVIAVAFFLWPKRLVTLAPTHEPLGWPRGWPRWGLAALAAVVLASTLAVSPTGLGVQSRWKGSFHRFTWGAGIESMKGRAAQ